MRKRPPFRTSIVTDVTASAPGASQRATREGSVQAAYAALGVELLAYLSDRNGLVIFSRRHASPSHATFETCLSRSGRFCRNERRREPSVSFAERLCFKATGVIVPNHFPVDETGRFERTFFLTVHGEGHIKPQNKLPDAVDSPNTRPTNLRAVSFESSQSVSKSQS